MLIRYPGAKMQAARDLLALAPDGFREYRECFAGSAAMLWEVPTDVARWVNDIDPRVVRFLTSLRDDPRMVERVQELRARFSNASIEEIERHFQLCKYHWGAERCPYAFIFLSRYDALKDCKHKCLVTLGHCGLTHRLYCRGTRFNVFFRRCRYSSVLRARQPEVYEMVVTNY